MGVWTFMALLLLTFFLASAGASAAYLTVSEIFPMETRAMAIAFFYAIGTAIGGISGPLLFGRLIATGEENQVAIGFFIGAAVMAIGGIVELFYGVKAEGKSLEDIARPLSAEDAEGADGDGERPAGDREPERPAARAAGGRFRPGPGMGGSSPGMAVSQRTGPADLRTYVGRIETAVAERPLERTELAQVVGARYWGPGCFNAALREAVTSGRVQRQGRTRFGPPATS
jgi:MFS family permease